MAKAISENNRRKILTGNLWRVVFSITWPLFLYQFINSFYSLLDAIMLVNISTVSSSAGAILAQVKLAITSFGAAIASGGSILISRFYGAGDIEKARKYSNVMLSLEFVVIGLILLVFMPFAEPIMRLCGCNDAIVEVSKGYFRLQLVEQCLICINNAFIAEEKSKGNTKIISICNIAMLVIKLGLNYLFVFGLKVEDMIWVELASIIAQIFMMVVGLFYLFDKNNPLKVAFKSLSLKWAYSKTILKISFPLFLGKFVISMGKVAVNAICGTLIEGDTLLVGALGISNNICGMVTNPGNAVEDTESTIVSQNVGSLNMKRALKTFLICFCYDTIWTLIGFLIVRVFFMDNIIDLFLTGEESSPAYVETIRSVFYYDCLSIVSLGTNVVILGLLYGYGQTFLATINNLLRIATRIGVLLFCKYQMPMNSLTDAATAAGLSMGISNLAIMGFAIIILIIFLLKVHFKGYKGMHFSDPEPKMVEVDGVLMAESLAKKQSEEKITASK